MEYMIFALVLFGCIFLFSLWGWVQEKRQEKEFVIRLKREYGLLPEREYSAEQYERISHYFLRHKKDFYIDNITWSDLEMDVLFKRMNYTFSSAGEELLYDMLRSPLTDPAALEEREKIITLFQEQEDLRVDWQFRLARLGRTGRFSIYDYLNNLELLGRRSSRIHFLAAAAFLAAIASIFYNPSAGVLLLILVLIFNVTSYFRIKKETEPYIVSFAYLFRLLHCVEQLEKHRTPLLEESIRELRRCRAAFRNFKRGSYLLMSPARLNASGNPLEVILDYLRMGLHLDLIQFNYMLSQVRLHTEEIDRMLTVIGSLEAMIAIGAWRTGLSKEERAGYTVPEFHQDRTIRTINGTGLYHPLLNRPVPNDIHTDRSILLTGSNASGKSTFLKTVALNAILAQTVHTCTATRYHAGLYRIASSMSLRDDILGGDSYYMVEIKAMKRLLDLRGQYDGPILIFVDEVLRGTNTVERIAASTQILRSLNGSDSICFAATHDIELTHLLEKEYTNYHFSEEFCDGDICFSYRLKGGRATTRNAIKLLQSMGYEQELIEDAERLAEQFIQSGVWAPEIGVRMQ